MLTKQQKKAQKLNMKTGNNPFPNYKSLQFGSPERCVATWLDGWTMKQESRMQKFYTKTYLDSIKRKKGQAKSKEQATLDQAFTKYVLLGAEIIDIKTPEMLPNSKVSREVDLKLWLRTPTDSKQIVITAQLRIIKEKAPYTASEHGTWGINPPSAYSIFNEVRNVVNKHVNK